MSEGEDLKCFSDPFDDTEENFITEAIFLEPGVYYPNNITMANRPSYAQLEGLVEFLEQNPGIAKGLLRTAQGKLETKRKWENLATTLNSLGGANKNGQGWAKYWAEKKCALKKQCAEVSASMRRTGGGTADNLPTLSALDDRLVAVMGGQEFATGDARWTVNPFPQSTRPTESPVVIEHVEMEQEDNTAMDSMLNISPVPSTSQNDAIPATSTRPLHSQKKRSRSTKQTKRFVFKNGDFNIDQGNTNHQGFFSRWFVTMVEARWRWTLVHFFLAFTGDWLFFGFIYWIIALTHGDLTEDHLPPNQNETEWTPCVANIYGFTSTFLFSIEVHTTVAYGKRAITLECPQTITAMCLQCMVCSIFQAFMVGILFAKLTRPKGRTQTILFSRQAVVTLRDSKLCMIFRVGDMRKSRILNIKASVFVLKLGDDYDENYEQTELDVEMDGCESTFFLWPVSVIHVIDENSPLYSISAADLLVGKFEILAVFEGVIESTGQQVQARTSYTENDILWGRRFIQMVKSDSKKNIYDVDFSKLCETERIDTPLCSASEFQSMLSLFDLDAK